MMVLRIKLNNAQIKCLLVFSVFAIIGFGPISPGCLIGMAVVAFRPRWFKQLADNLYANIGVGALPHIPASLAQQTRKKCFLSILALFILDIAPVPVTPVVAFFIILRRPKWFYRLVAVIYHDTRISGTNP